MPQKPSVEPIPSIACVGRIASITPSTLSQSGSGYSVMKVAIEPESAGKKANYWFTYDPAWLVTGGDGFLFEKNFASQKQFPALEAFLYGRDVTREENAAFDAEASSLGTYDLETADAFLRGKFTAAAEAGVMFGYILSQNKEGTGVMGPDDKEIKILTPYLGLNEFFPLSPRGRRKILGKLDYAHKTAAKASQELGEDVEPMLEVAFDIDEYLPKR